MATALIATMLQIEMIGLKDAMTRRLLNDLADKGFLNKTAETNRRRYLTVHFKW